MGAQLATDDTNLVENLATYAYNLGLTFQIVDDILDIIGDPEEMGKPVGTDLMHGRGVMAVSNGPVLVDSDGSSAIAETVTQEPVDPIKQMMSGLRESGAVQIAQLQADEMGRRAKAALEDVPPSEARTELYALVDLVLKRHN